MTLSDLQLEANLPLLASATVLLDRKLRQGNYDRVLLSSRDCYLQAHLWRRMYPATPYEVIYWQTSRWARIKGSSDYLDYCRALLKGKVLIVDLCGTGESLETLFIRAGVRSDYLLIQSDPRKNHRRLLDGPGDLEGLNCAPHPTVEDTDYLGKPIYSNPLNVDWWKYFEDIGGKAFFAEVQKRTEFSEFIDAPDDVLLQRMKAAEALIKGNNSLFEPWHQLRRSEDWQ